MWPELAEVANDDDKEVPRPVTDIFDAMTKKETELEALRVMDTVMKHNMLFEPVVIKERKHRPLVFLELAVNGVKPLGRIEISLLNDIVPFASENFRRLCTGEARDPLKGTVMSYRGTVICRAIPQFLISGGDISQVGDDGTGGRSTLGRPYLDPENYFVKHDVPGIVGMSTTRDMNSIGSQFYITTCPAPWLDGRNVAFGRVVAGGETVARAESYGQISGRLMCQIFIVQSGEILPSGEKVYAPPNNVVPKGYIDEQHGSFRTDTSVFSDRAVSHIG